jgi:hypothetical protein
MARLVSLLGMLIVMSLAVSGAAQGQVNEADRAAIRQVIEAQLAAFQHDDGPGAYGFASPTIQQKFINPDIFMQMVRSGYPAVYRPQEVEFRELALQDGLLLQHVYLVGPDGRPVMAVYEMQRQPEGSWRINGCWLAQIPGESV